MRFLPLAFGLLSVLLLPQHARADVDSELAKTFYKGAALKPGWIVRQPNKSHIEFIKNSGQPNRKEFTFFHEDGPTPRVIKLFQPKADGGRTYHEIWNDRRLGTGSQEHSIAHYDADERRTNLVVLERKYDGGDRLKRPKLSTAVINAASDAAEKALYMIDSSGTVRAHWDGKNALGKNVKLTATGEMGGRKLARAIRLGKHVQAMTPAKH